MLEIRQLSVAVNGREILHDVNLTIKNGDTGVLFGPNGSGKTTLLMTIMGSVKYKVTKGTIIFMDKEITGLSIDERARMGIGMSFQRPPVVSGVKMRDMVSACLRGRADAETVGKLASRADLSEFLDRDINLGFSGGEIKRSEILQLMAQKPQLALLDEPESGVDMVNIALIGELINELLERDCSTCNQRRMGLIITHTGHILDYVSTDTGYVMCDGTIYCEGNPQEILKTVKEKGYKACVNCSIRTTTNE